MGNRKINNVNKKQQVTRASTNLFKKMSQSWNSNGWKFRDCFACACSSFLSSIIDWEWWEWEWLRRIFFHFCFCFFYSCLSLWGTQPINQYGQYRSPNSYWLIIIKWLRTATHTFWCYCVEISTSKYLLFIYLYLASICHWMIRWDRTNQNKACRKKRRQQQRRWKKNAKKQHFRFIHTFRSEQKIGFDTLELY